MNTKIINQENDEIISYDVFDKLANNRIIFLSDFIDDKVAADISAALLFLEGAGKEKITIYLNSEGGDIRSVFMIYDMMQIISSPIEIICVGSAMNESILLLSAGTKNMRYSTKNSIFCINQLSSMDANYSDLTNAQITHEQLKKDNKRFIEVFAKCVGKKYKDIYHLFDRQLFLTTQEAKKIGIFDYIIGEKKESNAKKTVKRRNGK